VASGTIEIRTLPIDISNQFNYLGSSEQHFAKVLYDPITKTVTGTISCRNETAFNTGITIFTVNSGYRPASDQIVPMIVEGSNGNYGLFRGTIFANGNIRQIFTSTATGLYCSFTYKTV